jgi:hypothetical protein
MKIAIYARAMLATILILVPMAIFSALRNAVSLMFLFCVLLGTCLFWIIITGWAEENRGRIKGRTFEFLFFLFLFIASYFITVASSSAGPGLVQRNFIRLLYALVFVISAVFSGFLHYIKKIYN